MRTRLGRPLCSKFKLRPEPTAEEEDEDNMEEIDTENIVFDRTRGKRIDYVEAERQAKEAGEEVDDDDDDDDEDFEERDDDAMQE